jgi:CheY-like chemotaxis protein
VPTLLVADGNLAVRRLIALMFAGRDINVVSASDGDEAVRMIDATPPDIVLADIDTAGVSGYDIASHVHRSSTLSHVPVLLMASAFQPAEEARASAVGAAGVLTKPLDPAALIAEITDLVARPRPAAIPVETLPRTAETAALDDYFSQLDRAIATRVAVGYAAAPLANDEESPRETEQPPAPNAAERRVESAAPAETDALIEQVTRRVLERLAKSAGTEAAGPVAPETVERLVAEEFERNTRNIT